MTGVAAVCQAVSIDCSQNQNNTVLQHVVLRSLKQQSCHIVSNAWHTLDERLTDALRLCMSYIL